MLGLLALLIGFTFSLALGRYDERRSLVLHEANALGTTWLRTDLLDTSDAKGVRTVLRRYIDARVDFANAKPPGRRLTSTHAPPRCRPNYGPL